MAHITSIDPFELLLSGHAYIKLTLPDPPPTEILREMLDDMTPDEKRVALARVRALTAYANALERELKKG